MKAKCLILISLIIMTFSGMAQPTMPVMDSVSITPAGDIIIGWQANPASENPAYYVIYRVTALLNDSIDFVNHPGTSWVSSDYYPCDSLYSFAISVTDDNGLSSPGTYNIAHRNILLKDIQFDPCANSNLISWFPYINFDPNVEGYRIYARENGGPYSVITTTSSTAQNYVHSGLNTTTNYEYLVRAFTDGGNKTSSSCVKGATTYDVPVPQFLYQRYATVLYGQPSKTHVRIYVDTNAVGDYYNVYRSTDYSGPYDKIGRISPIDSTTMTYWDRTAETDVNSYYYKITSVDICGNEFDAENYSRTILLAVTSKEDRTNLLEWNMTEEWTQGVDYWEVWTRVDGNLLLTPSATLSGGTTSYIDDIAKYGGAGTIQYYIEAWEKSNYIDGEIDYSRSNIAEATYDPKVYMPNGFIPNGQSGDLKPVFFYLEETGYRYDIFNRWGQPVFQTSNPEQGWDGKFEGEYVDPGVYVYMIQYQDNKNNEPVYLKGTVAVIF